MVMWFVSRLFESQKFAADNYVSTMDNRAGCPVSGGYVTLHSDIPTGIVRRITDRPRPFPLVVSIN